MEMSLTVALAAAVTRVGMPLPPTRTRVDGSDLADVECRGCHFAIATESPLYVLVRARAGGVRIGRTQSIF